MLDPTKKITAVTYNGTEMPLSGGGGGGETCEFRNSGPHPVQMLYTDVNGNIVLRDNSNPVGSGETVAMKRIPFSFSRYDNGTNGGSISGGIIYTATSFSSALRYNLASSTSVSYPMVCFPTSSIITIVTSCFLPDSLITLADGTKKQIKDLTYSDSLKVWNFDTGTYDTAPICWLTRSGLYSDHYYKLTFSDGTILKTTGQNSNHKVYNVDERFFKGVDKTEIGDRIFSENGIVTVTNKEYIEEEIEYYNLITTGTINCFAEGILTSDRYGNLYPIDENMMYIKDGRYRPYEEFEAVGIKRYWYDTLRLAEVSGTIEETQQYIAKLECQMRPLPEETE